MLTFCLALALTADNPPFKFTSKRDDDRITATMTKDRTVIDITSPHGISDLKIERTGEAWPETLVLRIRMTGLEMFRAKSEKLSIEGSVLSHTDFAARFHVEGKKDDTKDPKSPYFLDFKMVGKDGKPAKAIPLRDGYFELILPKPFFEGNPKLVNLSWIDFYRR